MSSFYINYESKTPFKHCPKIVEPSGKVVNFSQIPPCGRSLMTRLFGCKLDKSKIFTRERGAED